MRRRITTVLALAALAIVTAACGALFNSGPQQVTVNSAPAGADIFVDGQRMGETPMILELAKNENHAIELREDGYKPVAFNVTRKVGAAWVILDVLGGLVPIVIDAVTGSWYTLSESNITGTLEREGSGAKGVLAAEQLEAVKRGVPAATFIRER